MEWVIKSSELRLSGRIVGNPDSGRLVLLGSPCLEDLIDLGLESPDFPFYDRSFELIQQLKAAQAGQVAADTQIKTLRRQINTLSGRNEHLEVEVRQAADGLSAQKGLLSHMGHQIRTPINGILV